MTSNHRDIIFPAMQTFFPFPRFPERSVALSRSGENEEIRCGVAIKTELRAACTLEEVSRVRSLRMDAGDTRSHYAGGWQNVDLAALVAFLPDVLIRALQPASRSSKTTSGGRYRRRWWHATWIAGRAFSATARHGPFPNYFLVEPPLYESAVVVLKRATGWAWKLGEFCRPLARPWRRGALCLDTRRERRRRGVPGRGRIRRLSPDHPLWPCLSARRRHDGGRRAGPGLLGRLSILPAMVLVGRPGLWSPLVSHSRSPRRFC